MVDRERQAELRKQIVAMRRKIRQGGKLTAEDRTLMMEAAKFVDAMPEHAGCISAVELATNVLKNAS